MSTQLELGRVCAVSVDHHWTLEGGVRIQLRPHDTTQLLSPENIISRIKEHSLWISRGNGLSLAVQFNHCDSFSQPDFCLSTQRLFSALRNSIVGAELWKQLELDVNVLDNITDPPGADHATFSLGIRHSLELPLGKVKRLHRLNVGDSAADLRPPGAVEVLELERILVTLNLKHEDEGKIVSGDADGNNDRRNDEAGQGNNSVFDQNDEEMLDAPDSMMLAMGELSPLLLDETIIAFMQHRSSQIVQSSGATPLSSQPTSSVKILSALDLLDATFRSLICSKPTKLPLGVWLPQSTNDLSLSALAPSLLCPGYAKAVAERACFLPTITHALSSSLLRHARSTTLRGKLEALRVDNVSEDDPGAAPSFSDIVKAKLWRTIQRGVFREDAARCLKSLKAPSQNLDTFQQEDDDDDNMLRPIPYELVTVPLRARKAECTSSPPGISTISPESPILLGRLFAHQGQNWDGGLLAQPVNSDLFRRMLYAPDTQRLSSHFDKGADAGDLVQDADSILNDEEYHEYDSILDDNDNDSILDDNDSLLDDNDDDNDSLIFKQEDADEDDFIYPHSLTSSTILQDPHVNPLSRFEGTDHDHDKDALFLPQYVSSGPVQQEGDALLQDDTSDLDILLQDVDDSDGLFTSQESSLPAMIVYSDIDTTTDYYNHVHSATHISLSSRLHNSLEAGDRTFSVCLPNNNDNLREAWQWQRRNGMMAEECEDEWQDDDMLGPNLEDSDEEMLAF